MPVRVLPSAEIVWLLPASKCQRMNKHCDVAVIGLIFWREYGGSTALVRLFFREGVCVVFYINWIGRRLALAVRRLETAPELELAGIWSLLLNLGWKRLVVCWGRLLVVVWHWLVVGWRRPLNLNLLESGACC